jgi:ABC-2 type transport system permease protein
LNIYLFEFKAQLKGLVIWTAVLLALLFAFMSGIYPAFYESMDVVMEVMGNLPPAFAAAFGIMASIFLDFTGFFSFTYNYLIIAGAIMAVSVSVSVFSREKRSKCTDFLLTKPVERKKIFAAKLLAALTVIIAANIVFIIALIILYTAGGHDMDGLGKFVYSGASLFFTQLVFMAIGVVIATAAKKIRSVSGTATAIGFAGFILSALYGIIGKEAIKYIAPMKYFDPAAIFSEGTYEIGLALTAAGIFFACLIVSYVKYCNSDTRAV